MTTLMTTRARPGDTVVVTGLGPVGYLCACLFALTAHEVHGVDPDKTRRDVAARSGVMSVHPDVPIADSSLKGRVALVVECSGTEAAALDAVRIVRKGGEVVLVGVPWKRSTDLTAHELLDVVFRNYVTLRSGWEWELPRHNSEFQPHSIFESFRIALEWLRQRRIPLDGCVSLHRPAEAQAVYQGLLARTATGLFHCFDWRNDE